MNQQAKTTKKPKTKSKAQIRDLKPKKDAKGGTISFNYGTTQVEYKPQKP